MQVLGTGIYKIKNGVAPQIMKDIVKLQNPSYNLRSSCNQFRKENIKTVHYGFQSIRYLGPKIWELVPNNIKYSNSLSKFKKLIKSWKPETFPWRLCKTYIAQVGFKQLSHYVKNIWPVTYKVIAYKLLRWFCSNILFKILIFFNFNCYCHYQFWSVGIIYTHL